MTSLRASTLFSFLFLAAMFQTPAQAQTLRIGDGDVRRGGQVEIPIDFEAGSQPVIGFSVDVVYDPRYFGQPTCTAIVVSLSGCAVHHGSGFARFAFIGSIGFPLSTNTYGTLTFPALFRSPSRTAVVPLGARGLSFLDEAVEETDFTIYTGRIRIQ